MERLPIFFICIRVRPAGTSLHFFAAVFKKSAIKCLHLFALLSEFPASFGSIDSPSLFSAPINPEWIALC
ncbi:MAG: hypothetical protein MPW15_27700 [Candidatus Manganitrophus sp.]|nr:hypothetical protein [Candidatus Manganitrophus sp.]